MYEDVAVEVVDLRNPDIKLYYGKSLTPRKAVICAYAQEEKDDWNTWDYEKNYGHLVEEGERTFLCGDYSCFKDGHKPLTPAAEFLQAPEDDEVDEDFIQESETPMPAKINLDPSKKTVVQAEKSAPQPKRGRGRPKKNPDKVADTPAAQVEEIIPQPKRGRGRPKKHTEADAVENFTPTPALEVQVIEEEFEAEEFEEEISYEPDEVDEPVEDFDDTPEEEFFDDDDDDDPGSPEDGADAEDYLDLDSSLIDRD